MKKLLVILSALALSVSFANAQMRGDGEGSGTMNGSGPHGHLSIWDAVAEYIDANPDDASGVKEAYVLATSLRTQMQEARAQYILDEGSIEGWAPPEEIITALKTNMETIRTWFRENRPDRPDPVMTGEMVQRRLRFRTNSDGITQAQKRLRELQQSDPDNPECQQLREQLGNLLGERKQLLREQRRGEGGPGGEGNGHRGG